MFGLGYYVSGISIFDLLFGLTFNEEEIRKKALNKSQSKVSPVLSDGAVPRDTKAAIELRINNIQEEYNRKQISI